MKKLTDSQERAMLPGKRLRVSFFFVMLRDITQMTYNYIFFLYGLGTVHDFLTYEIPKSIGLFPPMHGYQRKLSVFVLINGNFTILERKNVPPTAA